MLRGYVRARAGPSGMDKAAHADLSSEHPRPTGRLLRARMSRPETAARGPCHREDSATMYAQQ